MRTVLFLLVTLLAIPLLHGEEAEKPTGPVISRPRSMQEVNRRRLFAYQDHLAMRRDYALHVRRQMNAGKVHVYYRYNPWAMSPFWSAIEQGWVRQPPIPCPRRYDRGSIVIFNSDEDTYLP